MVALNFAVESNVAFQLVQHCSHCENLRTELPFFLCKEQDIGLQPLHGEMFCPPRRLLVMTILVEVRYVKIHSPFGCRSIECSHVPKTSV